MKYTCIILLFVLAVLSCKNESKRSTDSSANEITKEISLSGDKSINVKKSIIFWKGHKLLGNHSGIIDLDEGKISFDNGDIISGSFVANMKSIAVTELMDEGDEDEEEEEEESPEDDKADLANHLMNEDFFDVGKFPTASFIIRSSKRNGNSYSITGDMTIKDVTKEITFDAMLIDHILKSELEINRTDFGIKYGSGSFFKDLGDRVIKDKFDLILSLSINP